MERYIKFKEAAEDLALIDSRTHGELMRGKLEEVRREGNEQKVGLEGVVEVGVGGGGKTVLRVTKTGLQTLLSEDWAFSVLSLFTLDVFLDVLTLLMLEEKMVFVCSDTSILTYAIFLFTRVLLRPFEYPYPVVTLIPDQEDYLNAPFPVVYGLNKTREEVLAAKLPRRFKNVFVFFDAGGVEVVS